MADVRILKFDAGSPVDQAFSRIKQGTHSGSNTETFKRAMSIADFIVGEKEKGNTIVIKTPDGKEQAIRIV